MKEVTSTARRKFSFPSPVDVDGDRADEQNHEKNDERQTTLQSAKVKRMARAVSKTERDRVSRIEVGG